MKVLFVTPDLPAPAGGGSGRMYGQMRYLRSAGVRMDLLSYSGPGGAAAAGGLAERVWLYRPEYGLAGRLANLLSFRAYSRFKGFEEMLGERLGSGNYDLVHVHKFQMAGYLAKAKTPPVVVDLWACGLKGAWRDALQERGLCRKAVGFSRVPRFYAADRALYPSFENYFVVSEEARSFVLKRYPGKKVYVVPHGVEIPPALCAGEAGGDLIFVGDMSFSPNIAAVLFFYEKIFPILRRKRPGLKFCVVGKNPAPEILALKKDSGVLVAGYVEKLAVYFEKAAVFVAPMRSGLGLRTKLLEAFSYGLPVVATRSACEGIPLEEGREALLAESAEEFAAKTEKLLSERTLARELGARARALVERQFSWPAIAADMKRIYDEILYRHHQQR